MSNQKVRLDLREVYFVQAFELKLIKIGVTNDTHRRIVAMQTLSPDRLLVLGVQLCPNGGRLEERLHCRFAEFRQHGEWFSPAPKLLRYIEENTIKLSDVPAARARMWVDDEIKARVERAHQKRRARWLRANGFAASGGVLTPCHPMSPIPC